MRNPKEIIVTKINVHQEEIDNFIEGLKGNNFNYKINDNQIIIINKGKTLEEVLDLMLSLESECWKWEEIYEPGTVKEPMWIGIDINSNFGPNYKYCLGINLENGTNFSVLNNLDAKADWYTPHHTISVKYGEDKRVFDDNNELNL